MFLWDMKSYNAILLPVGYKYPIKEEEKMMKRFISIMLHES